MTTQLTPVAQRILGIIYASTLPGKASCIAGWRICDALGVDRGQLRCMIPGTEYDSALKELINADLVEEVPNLGLRYQLKKGKA
jgi:hypothetical protein